MKKIIFFISSLLIIASFFFYSCKKDDVMLLSTNNINKKHTLVQFNWSGKEQLFFSSGDRNLKNAKNYTQKRSGEGTRFHLILIKAYNQIAKDNENFPFVDDISARVGTPL